MILDGWGFSHDTKANAIALADTPAWDALCRQNPVTYLNTSGGAVGLPEGQMGNSEVGHMNIGAGRIVFQDLTRIENAIADGSFASNNVLCEAIDAANAKGGTVHIMGLLSPGGVHSHEDQFFETIKLADARRASKIRIHAFLDGRDTPPKSALASLQTLQALVDGISSAKVATISGRYFAMDRDKRWNRVEKAYRAISQGMAARVCTTTEEALMTAYDAGESDEFVQPAVIGGGTAPYQGVRDNDAIIFINFRADRARELTAAFVDSDFRAFERPFIELSGFVCMTQYSADLKAAVAFAPDTLPNIMAEVLARAGLRQLRIAETEKYAHVTFFLNGGIEEPFPNEERKLIPSPRVDTYDLQPEMSAPELTRELVGAIESGQFDVIICNVANPDMVGHTGLLAAAIKAVEAVDDCISAVANAVKRSGGELLITADHGNIEKMIDTSTGQPHTSHTTNPVPLLFLGRKATIEDSGSLRDIAPTMLYLLDLEQPGDMTGQSLLDIDP
jgi:2,3-bisphosphoglycerate-independent phosphoglycerate mutase